jgi:hypothetical protein
MCRMESSLTLPRVVRGAEKLRSGYEIVGLKPPKKPVEPCANELPSMRSAAAHLDCRLVRAFAQADNMPQQTIGGDAAVRRDACVALGDRLLHRDRTADARHRRRWQTRPAGRRRWSYDATVVLGDLRIDEVAAQCFEAFERAFLIRP